MKRYATHFVGWWYRHVGAPIFFLWDSEPIHEFFLNLGEMLARVASIVWGISIFCRVRDQRLATTVAGIAFDNPIGLAAGFDYNAQLPGMIHALGFGFESVGTVTNGSYGGNEYPRIKRLVRSRSILVNKGFKSFGMRAVVERLAQSGASWKVPIGISVGQTNTRALRDHADAIRDIQEALTAAVHSRLPFSYFELNISCPNLNSDIIFYDPAAFDTLLSAIETLALPQPLFVKMPIHLTEGETVALLRVCAQHAVAAVIIGNLSHDRADPSIDKKEIAQLEGKRGSLSGKPCEKRSDELVRLAYETVGERLAVIGCGGVFTAEDAYRKIKNGASLIQLATATIFEGPQVAGAICAELPRLLEQDGFAAIAQAVGADVK